MIAKISKIEVFCIGMPLVGTFTSGGVSKNVTKQNLRGQTTKELKYLN